jgi:3-hydroxyacyl-CoA dehydrogenase/enoyl-CoA hydratase/3-hydroxybutyryl-CoA epimerase
MTDLNIQTELDADGILLASIDMPGRAMNVFSRDMMDSLERLVIRSESDASIKAVVLTSGKSAFLAGADLDMIRMFTEQARSGSTSELHELFGHLGRVFRRLEQSPKPFVAAINGLALGGGLEVCLACHARIAADDPAIQLGLPEIKLGLLPGAGGTQRLPRLIGTAKGMQMLLTGDPVAPAEALALGLVHELVPADQLIAAAKRRALALSKGKVLAPWDVPGARHDASPYDFSSAPAAYAAVAKAIGISEYQLRYYPAYTAILGCVVGGWHQPMTEAGEHEMRIFVELMRDPVAGNMVRTLFLNRQKAAKLGLLAPNSPFASGEDALLPRIKAAGEKARSLACGEDERLLALSLAALRVWNAGKVEQPELADVAVVSAGLCPSYTGGPFTYAQQRGADDLRRRAEAAQAKDAGLFALPAGIDRYFRAAG